ncbi:MAG: histidine kinase dimerization/phospho-acceptor domain-containing protein [Sphingomicrobium sp.]
MLRQPAADRRDAAVRWRQLVDLIARAGAAADPELLSEALAVIRADAERIDEPLRAAAARAIAALPLPLGLLESFVADRLAVSAPIIAAASLDAQQWQVVLRSADPETRRFIETLHPDLESPIIGTGPAVEATSSASELSIGELVSRIERRRGDRVAPTRTAEGNAPAPPTGQPALFHWETGANGDIDWVAGVPRGALVGRSLAKPIDGGAERIADDIVRALANRSPFREAEMIIAGDGPAAGQWLVSGAPSFDPADGRFRGYRGRAQRDSAAVAGPPTVLPECPAHLPLDGDSLRELVHELKTPLNAIIGFSEIIDGQYLGPAGRRYRDRANDIAGEARLLLAAIDDLDLAAKVQTGADRAASSHLDGVVAQCVAAHRAEADERGVELVYAPPIKSIAVPMDGKLLERLISRLLSAVIELAVSGERLRLVVEMRGATSRFTVTRPVALAGTGAADHDSDYSLQLARGLARIVGGDVTIDDNVVGAEFASA